jgi:UDP-GlcNAc:undecaprenyl-phosphate GlcNAc-1-phosphate transferase
MLVGLLLSAAAVTATSSADPQAFTGAGLFLPITLPLLVPLAVLAIPFVDLLLAVIRRVSRGHSPFAPDKRHLHHRMLELGHSHRRAVLLLYFWSALLAFGAAAFSIYQDVWVVVAMLAAGVVLGVLMLVVPRLRSNRTRTRTAKHAAAADASRPPAPPTTPAATSAPTTTPTSAPTTTPTSAPTTTPTSTPAGSLGGGRKAR